jgi:hypothetical protein
LKLFISRTSLGTTCGPQRSGNPRLRNTGVDYTTELTSYLLCVVSFRLQTQKYISVSLPLNIHLRSRCSVMYFYKARNVQNKQWLYAICFMGGNYFTMYYLVLKLYSYIKKLFRIIGSSGLGSLSHYGMKINVDAYLFKK